MQSIGPGFHAATMEESEGNEGLKELPSRNKTQKDPPGTPPPSWMSVIIGPAAEEVQSRISDVCLTANTR